MADSISAARIMRAIGDKTGEAVVEVQILDLIAVARSVPEPKQTDFTRKLAARAEPAHGCASTCWVPAGALVQLLEAASANAQ